MKYLITLLIALVILVGCQQNEEPVIRQETGVVVDYAGDEYCSIIIELDNGTKIQPLHYPENFEFVQGQRLLVNYAELPNIASTCGKGIVCELIAVEVLDCGYPITESTDEGLDAFQNDPVIIHEINVDDACLSIKVSYSGGCRNHDIRLVKVNEENQDAETAVVELRHDANGDLCEAAISKDLQFSLSDLKEQGYSKFLFKALLINGETYREIFDIGN